MTGLAMSVIARSAAMRCTVDGSARNQPMRSPPQTGFDNEPIVIARASPKTAVGGGISTSSRFSSTNVSSITTGASSERSMRIARRREAASIKTPLGF